MKVAFEALHGVSRQGFDTISPAKRVLVPGARLKDWAKRASQQVRPVAETEPELIKFSEDPK